MSAPAFTVSAIFKAVRDNVADVWSLVAKDVVAAEQALIKAVGPGVKDFVSAETSVAKQYASDMISAADGWLASHATIIAQMVEQTIDTELALATNGVSAGYNKLTNEGVDKMVSVAIAAAHNAGLAIKAKLATNAVQAQQQPNQILAQSAMNTPLPQPTKPSGE